MSRTLLTGTSQQLRLAVSTPIQAAEPGWPRPLHEWRWRHSTRCPELPDKLPVPWINGPCVDAHGDWHSFRERGLEEMKARRLCLICGTPVQGALYLPAHGDSADRATSGGGGHARCVLLAVKRCPHMVERGYELDDVIGWRWDGPGLGLGPFDEEFHGDHDPVDAGAVEVTLRQLREAAREATHA